MGFTAEPMTEQGRDSGRACCAGLEKRSGRTLRHGRRGVGGPRGDDLRAADGTARGGHHRLGRASRVPRPRADGARLELLVDWVFATTSITRLGSGTSSTTWPPGWSRHGRGFVREGVLAGRLKNPDGTFSDEVSYARLRPGPSAGSAT